MSEEFDLQSFTHNNRYENENKNKINQRGKSARIQAKNAVMKELQKNQRHSGNKPFNENMSGLLNLNDKRDITLIEEVDVDEQDS